MSQQVRTLASAYGAGSTWVRALRHSAGAQGRTRRHPRYRSAVSVTSPLLSHPPRGSAQSACTTMPTGDSPRASFSRTGADYRARKSALIPTPELRRDRDSAKSGRVNSANAKAISQRNDLPLFRGPITPEAVNSQVKNQPRSPALALITWPAWPILTVVPPCAVECRLVRVTGVFIFVNGRTCVARSRSAQPSRRHPPPDRVGLSGATVHPVDSLHLKTYMISQDISDSAQ